MSVDEGTARPSAKSGARLRRSCELCRNSKGRCVPSEEDSLRCQRCFRDGKQCVFLEAKPRPKRAKNSRIRVAEMEEKLDGLMALLSSGSSGNDVPPPPQTYPSPVESGLSSLENSTGLEVPQGLLNFIGPTSPRCKLGQPQSFTTFPSYPSFDRIQDVISQGIIGFQQAEDYVQLFRSKAHLFPFVIIPPYMSVDSFRREKPFLLLAILAFATNSDARLQAQLELILRETLSRKIIINGERSLDLLQGLLVYLTWYHFFFDMGKQQIYQICQMTSSMLIDLGFHKRTTQSSGGNAVLGSELPTTFFPKMSEEELDARRTFVGCYYITSSISQAMRKPNILKSSDYLEECAESLAAAAHNDTDALMPYFVHMQRLYDEVSRAFDYENPQIAPVDTIRIEVLVQAFQLRFSHLQNALPEKAFSNLTLKMSFFKLRIYINEIGFHALPLSEAESVMSNQISLQSWYYSSERNNCLGNCLSATKDYLDQILAFDNSDILDFTLLEFLSLVYAILILGSFATKSKDQMVDAARIRKTANFEYYINALSEKMLNLISASRTVYNNPCLNHMYALFEQSKMWYTQMILDPIAADFALLGRPEHSFMNILPTLMSRCMDFQIPNIQAPISLPDNLWSDLISETTAEPLFLATNHLSS